MNKFRFTTATADPSSDLNLSFSLESFQVAALRNIAGWTGNTDHQGRAEAGELIRQAVSEFLWHRAGADYQAAALASVSSRHARREKAERRLRRMQGKKAARKRMN